MTRRAKPARYRLSAHPGVPEDLAALAVYGPLVVTAARARLDDLAHGRRVTGSFSEPDGSAATWLASPASSSTFLAVPPVGSG
ncbi:MAG: hypothetical protein ACRDY2_01755 [Acidimicrobiales bacterium]